MSAHYLRANYLGDTHIYHASAHSWTHADMEVDMQLEDTSTGVYVQKIK